MTGAGERAARILLVDDDPGVVDWIAEELRDRGYEVHGVTEPEEALARIEGGDTRFDVVLSDVEMPGMRGPELLRRVHAARQSQLVVLMTAFGSIELAMACVRSGAADFLAKPFTVEALVEVLDRTLRDRLARREVVRLRADRDPETRPGDLVAESAAMREVLALAKKAARASSTVLLSGESGAGKGAVARFVHRAGPRAAEPFVSLNCAALPAGLVEAELFGVRRGAFTDARQDRPGLMAAARGGTLFLDEIGEMAPPAQPKLLLALDSGTYRPVGDSAERRFEARLVAATNRDPEDAVRSGALRSDLFHRLNVIRIHLPPLRERIADIPPLVDQLLDHWGRRAGRSLLGVTDQAMRWLCAHPWPGNVRELSNVIERAVALGEHEVVDLEDLEAGGAPPASSTDYLSRAAMQGVDLAELQRRYIEVVLARCDGNRARAAEALGINRTTLWRRLSREAE